MDTTEYTFSTLFQQLGLSSNNDAIDEFIASHRLIAAAIVDQLNACLRA